MIFDESFNKSAEWIRHWILLFSGSRVGIEAEAVVVFLVGGWVKHQTHHHVGSVPWINRPRCGSTASPGLCAHQLVAVRCANLDDHDGSEDPADPLAAEGRGGTGRDGDVGRGP